MVCAYLPMKEAMVPDNMTELSWMAPYLYRISGTFDRIYVVATTYFM